MRRFKTISAAINQLKKELVESGKPPDGPVLIGEMKVLIRFKKNSEAEFEVLEDKPKIFTVKEFTELVNKYGV